MEERWRYGRKAIENAWSVDLLELQIAGKLLERQRGANKIQNSLKRSNQSMAELNKRQNTF